MTMPAMNKLLWLKCCGSLCCSSSIVAMHATAVLRSCHNPVESFQQLLAEGRLIDVRIRCIHFLSQGVHAICFIRDRL